MIYFCKKRVGVQLIAGNYYDLNLKHVPWGIQITVDKGVSYSMSIKHFHDYFVSAPSIYLVPLMWYKLKNCFL